MYSMYWIWAYELVYSCIPYLLSWISLFFYAKSTKPTKVHVFKFMSLTKKLSIAYVFFGVCKYIWIPLECAKVTNAALNKFVKQSSYNLLTTYGLDGQIYIKFGVFGPFLSIKYSSTPMNSCWIFSSPLWEGIPWCHGLRTPREFFF